MACALSRATRHLLQSSASGVSALRNGSCTGLRTGSLQSAFSTRPLMSDDGNDEGDYLPDAGGGLGGGFGRDFRVGEGATVEPRPWNEDEKRTGALAMKVGMMAIWDSWSVRHVVTVLHMDECEVVQVKRENTDGYTSLQLGVGESKVKNTTKPLLHHFNKAGVKPKRKVMEFRVSKDALLPLGFRLSARHFVPGQLVDVCGTTKGKGFQGGMKRWGFAGQGASHGVSKTHRHIGSTGQCQDPGRVFKGKKMPGRMGGNRVTIQNLKVIKIDPRRDLLFVSGHIPGQNGGYVRIQDAIKGPKYPSDPPYPTFVPNEDEEMSTEDLWFPQPEDDPTFKWGDEYTGE